MSITWYPEEPEPSYSMSALSWILLIVRTIYFLLCTLAYVICASLVRWVELGLRRSDRPWSRYVTVFAMRVALFGLGFRFRQTGTPMRHPGAFVANHSSWLDILSINVMLPVFFVSKAEVAHWPIIGPLSRLMGTVFVERDRRKAKAQQGVLQERLALGQQLFFFPEGTSTDNLRVLPFKTTLFQVFLEPEFRDSAWIQPVSIIYHAPKGADPRYYAWFGYMGLWSHLAAVIGTLRHGVFELVFLEPVELAKVNDRKALALQLEIAVRDAHAAALADPRF